MFGVCKGRTDLGRMDRPAEGRTTDGGRDLGSGVFLFCWNREASEESLEESLGEGLADSVTF
jgi:hypothetical protein